MSKVKNLRRLLVPKHVCFIGGSAMAEAVKRCRRGGFKGEVWLVNTKHESISGVKCYASVADLPSPPDATFIGTRAEITLAEVSKLNEIGAGGAVCFASGFAETGVDGETLQEQLLQAAGDMPIIGPNCYGLLDFLHGSALWPVAYGGGLVEKGVAVLTSSGNFAYNLSMLESAPPISYLISVGNQANVGVADLIDALLEDSRVTAIGLHLEGLKNVSAFAEAAMRALNKGVPIVVLKQGVSSIGAEIAMSHTSALAGSDELYSALFDRVGAIRVDGPVNFVESLKILASGRLPEGRRVGAMTCSGGDAGLIADYCEQNNLHLTPLREQQKITLSQILPGYASAANPLDFTSSVWGNETVLTQCASAMFDGDFDMGFLALDFPSDHSGEQEEYLMMARIFRETLTEKLIPGVVSSVFPELMSINHQRAISGQGTSVLSGIEAAMKAMGKVADYVERRDYLLHQKTSVIASTIPAPALEGKAKLLNEWQSKQLLSGYKLSIPEGALVAPEEAGRVAAELGFPVVLKAVSTELPHKTEAGAVVLNLNSSEAVEAAADDIVQRLAMNHPHVDTSQLLIEKMSKPPVAELIVGVKREPGFGLALIIGAGGILVELVKDSASLLLPTNEQAVLAALKELKIFRLLTGFRGKAAADIDLVVKAIMAVADFAVDSADRLEELDVNPLLVLEDDVVVVDALVRQVDLHS